MVEGLSGGHIIVHRLTHLRRKVLRAESVASCEHLRHRERGTSRLNALRKCRANIEIKRVAHAARFFRAVEYSHDIHRARQCLDEGFRRERTIQTHLDKPDLRALLNESFNGLVQRLTARAHRDNDMLRVRSAHIIKEVIGAPRERGKLRHIFRDNGGCRVIILLTTLASLEVHIRILRRAAHSRMLRVEGALTKCRDGILVNHLANSIIANLINLLHFVRGAESVKEV